MHSNYIMYTYVLWLNHIITYHINRLWIMLKGKNSGIITMTIIAIVLLLIVLEIQPVPLITAFGQIPYLPDQHSSSENQDTPKTSSSYPSAPLTEINATTTNTGRTNGGTTSSAKVVILNFDDSYKSQYTYAKPILDKYGFKATFFEVCNWIDSGSEDDTKMTWQDIAELRKEGYDIQAHTMNHPHLTKLSSAELNFEVGQSKQCLVDHGINPTIFAYPYGEGSDNESVVKTVAKYYYLARTDTDFPLTFLDCDDGGNNYSFF
jgi:hypothetical protein